MAQAAQDVRAHLREGTGIGVTTRPELPPYHERFAIARRRRAQTFMRLLLAAPDLAALSAIRDGQRGGDAWTSEHDVVFATRAEHFKRSAA